jgi:hypothetical protein
MVLHPQYKFSRPSALATMIGSSPLTRELTTDLDSELASFKEFKRFQVWHRAIQDDEISVIKPFHLLEFNRFQLLDFLNRVTACVLG